jgi:response regulator of citrate/malate metabolism
MTELTTQLREELWAAERRVKQLQKALDALDPPKAEAKPKPAKKPRRTDWTPREGTIGAVANVMRVQTKPVSIQEVADLSGISPDTARRSLKVLRDREEVRLAGAEKRGRNNMPTQVFLPMPPMTNGRVTVSDRGGDQ